MNIFQQYPQGIPSTVETKPLRGPVYDPTPKQSIRCCHAGCTHWGPFELDNKMYCYNHLSEQFKKKR